VISDHREVPSIADGGTGEFGIDDGWPVLSEPLEQWVLEDHFPLGKPEYEHAGVQLVAEAPVSFF
jgi:mannitol-1-phosphate/altronate dehydrogenase